MQLPPLLSLGIFLELWLTVLVQGGDDGLLHSNVNRSYCQQDVEDTSGSVSLELMQTQATLTRGLRNMGGTQPELKRQRKFSPKVVFVKTHSTGSSTLTSILHRYCDIHNARCAVYPPDVAVGDTIRRPVLARLASEDAGQIDIWPYHATLEPDLFDQMMPGNIKVSLFREPISRVLSSFAHAPSPEKVMQFLAALQQNETWQWDCGPSGERMSVQVPLEKFNKLDLVMLTEDYDRSLLLLRRKLGWSLADLLYLRLKDHGKDRAMQSAVKELHTLMQKSAGDLTVAANVFVEKCTRSDEAEVYSMAKQRFQQQWNELPERHREQALKDLKRFEAGLDALSACCHDHPDDAYCKVLSEDNIAWNARQRADASGKAQDLKDSICQDKALAALQTN
mmetsp:Transcript_26539/g.61957  ORF Transcript_26539/g.61957 Transcript_26539/m.61957 type:complete len:394 (-) Transcript_26539:43-1224(-)